MRISAAARELGTSPRMLRYRESLGLLSSSRGGATHRQYSASELETIRIALELEQRYDVSPAALAFGVRVLADPAVAAAVRELGERTGQVAPPVDPVELERERALKWLGRSGVLPPRV